MSSRALAVVLAAAALSACGSTATSPPDDGGLPGTCAPACAAKECGPDGCGGTCGTCAPGASCGASGSCVAAPPSSLNCPAGQRCFVLERTAWQYACTAPAACQRVGEIGTYATYEGCRSLGCSGGNSSCGEQFGRSDPVVWECLACVAACASAEAALCPLETADGCVYGGATIPCVCR